MSERNDLIYGKGEAQTDKEAADTIAAQAATISLLEAEVETGWQGALEQAAVYVEKCADWRMEIGQQHKQDPHTGPCAQEQFWLKEAAKGIRKLSRETSHERA